MINLGSGGSKLDQNIRLSVIRLLKLKHVELSLVRLGGFYSGKVGLG